MNMSWGARAAAAAAAGAVAGAVLVVLAASGLREPADPAANARVFWVAPGETLVPIAERLDSAGMLPAKPLFGPRVLVAYAQLSGKDREIKSGEYDLSAAMTPLEILEKIVQGAVKTHEVTLPEGMRLDEVASRLGDAGITDPDAFLAQARDVGFARSLSLPSDSFEGYAYPETYRFRRHTPPEEVLERMLAEFRSRFTPEDLEAVAKSGFTLHQLVTLASIVEKESAQIEERPMIAGVYRNRLRIGMRLQSDPTVIYGIVQTRGSFDGNIRSRDLREDTAWNTYTRAGLPPGPIASPSIEAIRAVLHPADVPYLYFVARNDGWHEFSTNLTAHNAAVKRYQGKPSKRRGDLARSDDGERR
ncbi:MAG: endolytic transglycosylase MltG [Myxococcota bacterium]